MEIQQTNLSEFMSSQPYDVKLILSEFSKNIFENVFYINQDTLLENSRMILFDNNKWIMRPHIFCYDIYSEQYLYPIVLMVNNIGTIFDFIPENFHNRVVMVPDRSTIIKLLSYLY